MLKNTVLQQKNERDQLISRPYITREKLSIFKKSLKSGLVKVITGPRRAGKSVFAFLLLEGQDFAYLNFDDESLLKENDYDKLLAALLEVYPGCNIILFDEIQNLSNWELFVNKLHRRGYNLVITGSNAHLLSSELSSSLTGRYAGVEILPFSFGEFITCRGVKLDSNAPADKTAFLVLLDEYMKQGGFPEVAAGKLDAKSYLGTLFDAILLKDVVRRFRVRFTRQIYDLAQYLVANLALEFSYSSLRKALGLRSTATVEKYVRYLEEAYLVFVLSRFSFKLKEQLKAPKKAYFVDNGFVTARAFQFSQNTGRFMENMVFVELLRRGYALKENLFYYKTRNNREVDFCLREGLKVSGLIQVCFDTSSPQARSREIKALVEAGKELQCASLTVLTWDMESKDTVKGAVVNFVPLWKWLLYGKNM